MSPHYACWYVRLSYAHELLARRYNLLIRLWRKPVSDLPTAAQVLLVCLRSNRFDIYRKKMRGLREFERFKVAAVSAIFDDLEGLQ